MKATTLYLDEEDIAKAKKLGINLSEEIRKYIKNLLGESSDMKDLPDIVISEIDEWAATLKEYNTPEWRNFLMGRCRLIKSRTAFDISPLQLELEIRKRLEKKEAIDDEVNHV